RIPNAQRPTQLVRPVRSGALGIHWSLVIGHWSFPIWSLAIGHWSFPIWSLVIGHWSFPIRSLVIGHWSFRAWSSLDMKILAVIPARHASTRFPGKPLAMIAGKPLLQHVVERCQKAQSLSD